MLALQYLLGSINCMELAVPNKVILMIILHNLAGPVPPCPYLFFTLSNQETTPCRNAATQ